MKWMLVISAVAVFVLILASAGSAMAAEAATSDKFATSLEQSLKHYVMALEAYNSGNYGKVRGQLQAAASNAKHADPELADLLQTLSGDDEVWNQPLFDIGIASQIANTYNSYNSEYGWGYTQFNPSNPTAVPGGDIDAS